MFVDRLFFSGRFAGKAKLQQDETETTTDFQSAVHGSNDLSSSGSYIQKK